MNHTKITATERALIERWKIEELSNKSIAKRLGRHVSTIGREISRNKVGAVYMSECADRKAHRRQKRAWKAKHPLKNRGVYAYVIEHLRMGWSPDAIAGRLHREHPDDPYWAICKETIYAFIFSGKYTYDDLRMCLRRRQKRRRKQGRKVHRERIPERVSIHERPKEIEERNVLGHWEGDTVVGRGHKGGIHTTYERTSSLILAGKMNDLTAQSSIQAQLRIYRSLPKRARKTVTLDNGSEHVLHARLKQLHIKTYFADPYSSWQRGGNENANLWLRYYFPKGTDFSQVSEQEVADVVWELNNRPRRRLQYATPLEVFRSLLGGLQS